MKQLAVAFEGVVMIGDLRMKLTRAIEAGYRVVSFSTVAIEGFGVSLLHTVVFEVPDEVTELEVYERMGVSLKDTTDFPELMKEGLDAA